METSKYEIVTPNSDPLQAVIRKTNAFVDFTLQSVLADKKATEKLKEQLLAQRQLDEAQMQNVANNHPHVLEATEEDRLKAVAITLYNGMKNKVAEIDAQLEAIDKVFAEHEEEMAVIKEQTGIDLNAPAETVEEGQSVTVDEDTEETKPDEEAK